MGQSSPEADIFLEKESTRFRGPVDLIPDASPPTEPITLSPSRSDITLKRPLSQPDPRFSLEASTGTTVLDVGHYQADDAGRLRLGTVDGTGSIRVESTEHSGVLRMIADDTVRSYIGSYSGPEQVIGGRISVHDSTGAPGVVFEAEATPTPENAAGVLEVYNDDMATGRIHGQDGALELLPPDPGGGGITVEGATPTGSDSPSDVFVDLNDAAASQPRMTLSGTSGDVVVGRGALDQNRPGVAGRVKLHYGLESELETYLEAGGYDTGGDERGGELLLGRRSGGSVDPGGRLRANAAGVEVASGVGGGVSPVIQLTTDGSIQVAGSVQPNTLPPAIPSFVPETREVKQGVVAEVEMTVGDASSLTFEFGDQAQLGYAVTASITGYTDARLWVGIDTGNPGSGAPTVDLVAGDGSVSITSETSGVTGPLGTGEYPIRVKGSGASAWSDEDSVTIQQP